MYFDWILPAMRQTASLQSPKCGLWTTKPYSVRSMSSTSSTAQVNLNIWNHTFKNNSMNLTSMIKWPPYSCSELEQARHKPTRSDTWKWAGYLNSMISFLYIQIIYLIVDSEENGSCLHSQDNLDYIQHYLNQQKEKRQWLSINLLSSSSSRINYQFQAPKNIKKLSSFLKVTAMICFHSEISR